ncbi:MULTISPECIES: hypothetical protein [Streptacidiphilus]|uniref:Uncharacterized protein n=1 Tax=Streptacidiphilus cavernicola TaxID=3342716 RepID=A0ABV6UHM8_9ACTN|nr:hypothetical protein [Streptacidiphilus jeojiense]
MSFDVCFWWRGALSTQELYEGAADGNSDSFESSLAVTEFREQLTIRWPGIEQSLEPLAYDPDLDVQEDLSRFILITLPFDQTDRLPGIIELARSFGLAGYDPQTDQAIG